MSFHAKKSALFIFACAHLVLSVALCVLRIYTLYNFVDPATGFFTDKPAFVLVTNIVYAAVSVAFLIFSTLFGVRFATKKEREELPSTPVTANVPLTCGTRLVFPKLSTLRVFISVFCGLSLITFSVFSLFNLTLDLWDRLLQILAILAGLYLLLQNTTLLPLYSKRRSLSSLLPVFWAGAHMMAHFLRASRIASGEYHNWQIIMLCAIAVFFYLQLQFTTPARSLYHFGLYCSVGTVGAGLILIFTLPTLSLSSFWYYSAYVQYTNTYALMTLVSVCLYMLVYVFGAMRNLLKLPDETQLIPAPEAE